MDEKPPDNIFRFRRLKWGAPKRLRGIAAIDPPADSPRGGVNGWLLLVGLILAAATGMQVLGWL